MGVPVSPQMQHIGPLKKGMGKKVKSFITELHSHVKRDKTSLVVGFDAAK